MDQQISSLSHQALVHSVTHRFLPVGDIVTTVTVTPPIITSTGEVINELLLGRFLLSCTNTRFNGVYPELIVGDTLNMNISNSNSPEMRVLNRNATLSNSCPVCGNLLTNGISEYSIGRCVNKSCPGNMITTVIHFVTTMGLFKSFPSQRILSQLLTRGSIISPLYLFYLNITDLMFPDVSPSEANDFLNELHSIRGTCDSRIPTILSALHHTDPNSHVIKAVEESNLITSVQDIHMLADRNNAFMFVKPTINMDQNSINEWWTVWDSLSNKEMIYQLANILHR